MPDPDLLTARTPAELWHLPASAENQRLAEHAQHPDAAAWLAALKALRDGKIDRSLPMPIAPAGIVFLLAKVAPGVESAFGFVEVTLHAAVREAAKAPGLQQAHNRLAAAALGVASACGEYFGTPNRLEPHLALPGPADGDSVGLATLVACVLAREPALDQRPPGMPWRFAATGRWVDSPHGGYLAPVDPDTLVEKLRLASRAGYRRVLVVRGTPRPPGSPPDVQLVEIAPDLRKAIRQVRRALVAEAPPWRRWLLRIRGFQVRGPFGVAGLAALVVATVLLVVALATHRETIRLERKERVLAEYLLLHQNHRYTEALGGLERAAREQADLVPVEILERARAFAGQLAYQLPVPFAGSDHRVRSNREGTRLLGAAAGEAIEWELPSGMPSRRWQVTDGRILDLEWRDEHGIAAFSATDGTISWWDTRAEPVRRLTSVDLGRKAFYLAQAPDGSEVLALGEDFVVTANRWGRVRELELAPECLAEANWTGSRVHGGDRVSICLDDGRILQAAAPEWRFVERVVAPPADYRWSSLPWVPDRTGKQALGALSGPTEQPDRVARIDLAKARVEQTFDASGGVLAMAWPRHPEGRPATVSMFGPHPPAHLLAADGVVASLPAYVSSSVVIDGMFPVGEAAIGLPHLSRLPHSSGEERNAADHYEGAEPSFGTVSVLAAPGQAEGEPNPFHDVQPTAVLALADDGLILTGDEAGVVRAFAADLSTTRWRNRLGQHPIRWLGLAPDGELQALDASGHLHSLGQPTAPNLPPRRTMRIASEAFVVAQNSARDQLAIAPDPGMYLLGFGIPWSDPTILGRMGHVRLVQLGEGAEEPRYHDLDDAPTGVRAIAYSPDGSRLAIAGEDGSVEVRLAMQPDTRMARFATNQQAVSLVWSPDGASLYLGCVSGMVVAFSAAPGIITTSALNPYATTEEGHGPVTRMAWLDEAGTRLGVGHGQQDGLFLSLLDVRVRIWDTKLSKVMTHLPGHPGGTSLLVGLPGGRVLTGGADRSLRIWKPLEAARPR
jgi:hypothetical protein